MGYGRETFQADLRAWGVTQREFARVYGLHEVTVSRWGENGREVPPWVGPALQDRLRVASLEARVAALVEADSTLPRW